MRYSEIRKTITSSSTSDWALLAEGPYYLDQLAQVTGPEGHWVEIDHHHHLAVYKPDIGIRVAWGIRLEGELTFDGWIWPDRSIVRFIADGFWHGALVTRWTFLVVDGGRCYLPDPHREYTRTSSESVDFDAGPWLATTGEVALSRLLNDFVGRQPGEFERYFATTGITEVADTE